MIPRFTFSVFYLSSTTQMTKHWQGKVRWFHKCSLQIILIGVCGLKKREIKPKRSSYWGDNGSQSRPCSQERVGQNILIFLGTKNNFWNPHIGEPIRHLFRKNIDRRGRQGQKCQILTPKILTLGAKSIFWDCNFLSTTHITNTSRATIFPLNPLRFFSFPRYG